MHLAYTDWVNWRSGQTASPPRRGWLLACSLICRAMNLRFFDWRRTGLSLAFVGLLVALRFATVSARVEPSGTLKIQRPLMGTIWNIEVVHQGRASAARQAIDQ